MTTVGGMSAMFLGTLITLLAMMAGPAEAIKCYTCVGLSGPEVKSITPCSYRYDEIGVADCSDEHKYCYIVRSTPKDSGTAMAVDRGCAKEAKSAYCETTGGARHCYSWCQGDGCNSGPGFKPATLGITLCFLVTMLCMWI